MNTAITLLVILTIWPAAGRIAFHFYVVSPYLLNPWVESLFVILSGPIVWWGLYRRRKRRLQEGKRLYRRTPFNGV